MKQSMTNKNPLRRVMSVRGMGQVMTVTVGLIVLMIAFAIIRVNPKFCVNSISGANRAKFICGGSRLVRLPPW